MLNNDKGRKALGKGLGALIPTQGQGSERREFLRLSVDRIDIAASQPRTHFDAEAIEELSKSIAEVGLIQPLVVREKAGGYELIAGERRLRASKLAGIKEVPVVIKDVSDDQTYLVALIENIQRQDLNPLEEAAAYQKLLEDSGLTQAELARRVGKSRAAVANAVRLLNLPPAVQQRLADGELSAGHARTLVGLDPDEADALARRMVDEKLSVRDAEEITREVKERPAADAATSDGAPAPDMAPDQAPDMAPSPAARPRREESAQVRHVATRLQQTLGARVKIRDTRGRGKIEIYYDDYDVLQSILEAMGVGE